MPAVQYPFIDIAVHARVRERFSRGEAMVLFSSDLSRLLWANGAGAELFGHTAVYDLLDQGVGHADITFRQLEAAARQLSNVGDQKTFIIRIARGFQRVQAPASSELIRLASGEKAILFSVPVSTRPLTAGANAAQMLHGLDDPDTHMAVIGAEGEVIAASPGFASLGITQQAARTLITLAGAHPDRLVKRPVATGRGNLPAAVGKLNDEPALHLLFAVETATGHVDTIEPSAGKEEAAPQEMVRAEAAADGIHDIAAPAAGFTEAEAIDAVSGIEEVEETLEEITGGTEDPVGIRSEPSADQDIPEPEAAVVEDASGEIQQPTNASAPEEKTVEASAEAPAAERVEPVTSLAENFAAAPVAPGAPAAAAKESGFVFKPNSRATRFVWKIDAEGRFSEVSHEFAEAVGPHASNIIGSAFSDVAALFNLDPEAKLSEALARRDTWSGKTIYWPIEGTSLVVPVDLAALPTYTRNRDFDGFRGFGVVRLSDVQEDPLALGLTLGPEGIGHDTSYLGPANEPAPEEAAQQAPQLPEQRPEVIAEAAPRNEEVVYPEPDIEEDDVPEVEAATAPEPIVEDQSAFEPEIAGQPEEPQPSDTLDEPPALRISETPNRRFTDKIVQLHGASNGLTAAEQANFREIAKRLEAFGAGREEPVVPPKSDAGEIPAAEEAGTEKPVIEASQETIFEAAAEPEVATDTEEIPVAEAEDEVTEGLQETVSQIEVLSSFIPPRVKMTDGLSAPAVDLLPVAVLIHTGDRLIHGNPEFLRLTGYDSVEALSEVGGIDALLQRHDLENGAGMMMLVKADDRLVPVTARLQSVRWEDSNALMLALMPVETREEGKGEVIRFDQRSDRMVEKVAKLQVEVEELRSILETATDGVVVIGTEGDIRSMNRSASALFNYDEQETRGKPFVMLFAHESQKAVLDYLHGLSGHGVASVLNDGREVIGREAAGGFVPLFMTMGRLTSSNGYCAVIRDITQWKRTEEELRNAKGAAETANAHKTDFLARVSHEIRTPLNAIIGFSDMMASERFGPIGHPRYIEYANDIGRSGRHVLDIVNDLLDISKIEAGEMDLDFASVGLNEAISEAVALVQPQANSQRVIIRTALSQSVPDVVADLRSIKQIALNILSNAIRFTPSGGQIVVSTSYEANGSVAMRVRDTGIGMTRSELDQAMKPFRQVSSTQSRHRGDGTGLGLPLTKAMVDANRAIFSISSAPNEGTLVEITFPSQRVLAG
ncbi:PAS domain S-box-containing protein [Rhizobium sp. BK529]|uniref:sensor histidine kinase n=1 Tax=unclassified Rhizobium TaxID=2613769 RepID=UPI001050564A|nr:MULTISPECIES: PAS domain-containing sensor histidine kinase [unclassified Rhizobium]MBB3592444.1 PAS domain S-box-containing protein [Rhizobium sp. BK529]TCS06834.1 PAS/PAC sensor signal transduction histidine kinase [Rhizobium sp. BK418]